MPDVTSTPSDGAPEPYAAAPLGTPEATGETTASAATPAGWYPTLTGDQQYWDGEKWLAIPPPPAAANSSADMRTPEPTPNRRPLVKWALVAGAGVLLLGLIGGGLAWKSAHDSHVAAVAAAAASEKAATQSREQQQREAATASAAKASQDDAERAQRRAAVTEIESGVKTMAEKHAATGVIKGPIISATCSPVAGGSTDDLTQQTTVFKCFVANKDNGDGTMSGYNYNATMNWSTGSFTYGFGAP
jgi:hypothetical protein